MLEKDVIGINFKFEIEFKEAVDREEGIVILNKMENEIVELCKRNNANFKNGINNFKREVK